MIFNHDKLLSEGKTLPINREREGYRNNCYICRSYTEHIEQMKKTIYLLIALAAFISCQDELVLNPAISLFSADPEIYEETAIFRLAYSGMADSTERVFPVTFGGSAEFGSDYTVSSDRFVFGGENPIDSIVVTTLRLGTDKTVSLSVEVPEGFSAGRYLSSEYTLQDKLAYLSFSDSYLMLCDSLDISFDAKDRSGSTKSLGQDAEITLSVNKEKSTATEGVDFTFSDSTSFIIRKGQSSGYLELKSLNPHPQDGRDKIVLNLGFGDKYSIGKTAEIEISLLDTLWKHLDESWMIDTLVTDSLYMDRYWKDICTGLDKLPSFEDTDMITFDMAEAQVIPSFRSDFKNFFKGISGIRKGSALSLDLGDGTTADLQTFLLDKTNRYFSADEESEDQESFIGVRFFPETTDSLDFYLIDYVSRSFMPELESLGKYAPAKPVAASPGLFLNITFTK